MIEEDGPLHAMSAFCLYDFDFKGWLTFKLNFLLNLYRTSCVSKDKIHNEAFRDHKIKTHRENFHKVVHFWLIYTHILTILIEKYNKWESAYQVL